MAKTTVGDGSTHGPADANVTATDDPAVQAQIDARKVSDAQGENSALKRRIRAFEDREADAHDKAEREAKEREGQEQRTRDDLERLTKENEELKAQLDEVTAPKSGRGAKKATPPANFSSAEQGPVN